MVLIEENPVEREYLLALVAGTPGVTLAAVYADLAEALPHLVDEPPSLVLLDLDSRSQSVLAGLRQLNQQLLHTAVLVLSAKQPREQFFQFLEAGVSGWLHKPCAADQIVRAILVLQDGGAVLSSQASRHLLDYFQARGKSLECLTAREQEIMHLLSQGRMSTSIAEQLRMSQQTLRTHISNILAKLRVNSRAEALAKYLNPATEPGTSDPV